jgi:hypothetical protein
MRGPVVEGARCGYASTGSASAVLTVDLTPFPAPGGPQTLSGARAQVQQLYDLGTSEDKADERIVDRASLGAGAFVHAVLVTGLPTGTAEDVTIYTPRWTFALSVPTKRLLAGSELTWAVQLAAALASARP